MARERLLHDRDFDCASFCTGYLAGTGSWSQSGQRMAMFTVCRHVSIIVAYYGNDEPLGIEAYDQILMRNFPNWSHFAADQYKARVMDPFLRRVRRGDKSLSAPVMEIMRNNTKNKDTTSYWNDNRVRLSRYAHMLYYHHFHRPCGEIPYDPNWYKEYEGTKRDDLIKMISTIPCKDDREDGSKDVDEDEDEDGEDTDDAGADDVDGDADDADADSDADADDADNADADDATADNAVISNDSDDADSAEDADDETDSRETYRFSLNQQNLLNGSTAKKLSLEDYLLATEGFPAKVREFLEKRRRNKKITVEDGQIAIEATSLARQMMLHVIGVNGDIFKKKFVDEMLEWIDDAYFAREEDLGINAAKGRVYLIEAILGDAVFSLSKGRIVMKASQLSPVGVKLLRWVQKLCNIQNKMIDNFISHNRKGESIYFQPFVPNLIQAVVGTPSAVYGLHDDKNPETQVRSKDPSKEQEVAIGSLESRLPFDYEQQVVTVVVTFGEPKEESDGHCELRHYLKSNKNKSVLTTITKNVGLHFQCHGVQRFCEHDVRPVRVPAGGSGVKRIILSFRQTVDWNDNKDSLTTAFRNANPNFDPSQIKEVEEYFKFQNILTEICEVVRKRGNSADLPIGGGTGKGMKFSDRRRANARTAEMIKFLKNYTKHESVKYFPRPGKKVAIPSEARKLLRHFNAVRTLIANNMYMSVKSKGEKAYTNYLDQIYELGQSYWASSIRKTFGVCHNPMHADLYNVKMETPHAMIPEQWYKNSFNEIRELLKKIKKVAADRGRATKCQGAEYVYEQPDGDIEIWFGPKGGNPTLTGQYGQPNPKDRNKEVTDRVESSQNPDSSKGLNENALTNAVFHLFVPADWGDTCEEGDDEFVTALKKKNEGNRKGQVIYLGLWYFHHAHTEFRPDWVDPEFSNTAWLRMTQTLYYCRPLYNADCKPPVCLHDTTRTQLQLQITGDDFVSVWMKNSNTKVRLNEEEKDGGDDTEIGIGIANDTVQDGSVEVGKSESREQVETTDYTPKRYTNYDVMGEWLMEQVQNVIRKCTDGGDTPSDDTENLCELLGELTAEELLTQAGRIGVAMFARALGHCLYGENKDEIGYLCLPEWIRLGWVCGSNAIPHPIRSYNLQTYVYIEACGLFDAEKGRFVLRTEYDGEVIADLLFKATVLRTAGTVGWYYLYADHKKKLDQGVTSAVVIPSMDDIVNYLEFLAEHSAGKGEGPMSPFNKCLYYKSLMACCKKNIIVYGRFLENVSQIYGESTVKFFGQGNKTREEWIDHVRDAVSTASGGDAEESKFVASLILADVEEVLENPFNEPKEVVYGSGGSRGIEMLKLDNEPSPKKGKKKAPPKTQEDQLSAGKEKDKRKAKPVKTHPERTKELFSYLQSSANKNLLTCLGLNKDDSTGKIHVTLNGRMLRITDLDNITCKLSIAQAKTTGARICIEEPSLNQIYDFPLFPEWTRFVTGGHKFEEIGKDAIADFKEHGAILFPSVNINFQYHEESVIWPQICRQMKDGTWAENAHTDCLPACSTGRRRRAGGKRKRQQSSAEEKDGKEDAEIGEENGDGNEDAENGPPKKARGPRKKDRGSKKCRNKQCVNPCQGTRSSNRIKERKLNVGAPTKGNSEEDASTDSVSDDNSMSDETVNDSDDEYSP